MKTPIAMLLFVAAATVAAPVAVAQRPDQASVRRLVEVTEVRKQVTATMEQVHAMMRREFERGLASSGKEIDPEMRALGERFVEQIGAVVAQELDSPEVHEQLVRAYADIYTHEEVQAQLAFYTSPVGRKVVARNPELMQRVMLDMQGRLPAVQEKVKALMNEFKAKALELQARRLREPQDAGADRR